MKIAFLIQCHKNPEQINLLLNKLKNKDVDCFVHVDKKSNIKDKINKDESIHFLPDELRVDVKWATFSQVEATLNLLKFSSQFSKYDYYCLISGQDYPVEKIERIIEFLEVNKEYNFINLFLSKNNGVNHSTYYDKRNEIVYPNWLLQRKPIVKVLRRLWVAITGGYCHTFKIFKRKQLLNIKYYFGSSWWCLKGDFINYVLEYLNQNKQYLPFFKKSSCSDECFFQTLFMNSPYNEQRMDYLHYIDWSDNKSSPKTLTVEDYSKISTSQKFFCRKIDGDFGLLNLINEKMLEN